MTNALSSKVVATLAAAFTFFFIATGIAQACMGVSRTITVNSFKTHMGTGASGGIGLRRGEVVLTFDDGPMGGKTSRVLNALSRECVKATFFTVGRMARANPKLLQRIARQGHTIAHHTESHANLARLNNGAALRQIDAGVRSVNKALGKYRSRSTKLFRYPYLARSARLDKLLRRRGMLPMSAGIMSQDWKGGSGAAMVNRVMSRLNRRGSGVILLHDIQGKTAAALPQLLRRLKAGGYRIVHIRGRGSVRPPKATPGAPQLLASAKTSRKSRIVKARKKADTAPRHSLFARLFAPRSTATTSAYAPKSGQGLTSRKAAQLRAQKARDARQARKDKLKAAKKTRARKLADAKARKAKAKAKRIALLRKKNGKAAKSTKRKSKRVAKKKATAKKPAGFAGWLKQRREARAALRTASLKKGKKRSVSKVRKVKKSAKGFVPKTEDEAEAGTKTKVSWWQRRKLEDGAATTEIPR